MLDVVLRVVSIETLLTPPSVLWEEEWRSRFPQPSAVPSSTAGWLRMLTCSVVRQYSALVSACNSSGWTGSGIRVRAHRFVRYAHLRDVMNAMMASPGEASNPGDVDCPEDTGEAFCMLKFFLHILVLAVVRMSEASTCDPACMR